MKRTIAPPLLPIFRSAEQMRLLAVIFLNPDQKKSITSWVAHSGVAYKRAQAGKEIALAVEAGVLNAEKEGRSKLVSANTESPYFAALQHLLVGSFGVPHILTDALGPHLKKADAAYLFGSWAGRLQDEHGPLPRDIDVLIVSDDVTRETIYEAIDGIDDQLPRPVQIVFRTGREWGSSSDSFVGTVRSRPYIQLWPDGTGAGVAYDR